MTKWRVEVGYVGLDKYWHWACVSRHDKKSARLVFNRFKDRERTRLYKDDALVCEVNGPEVYEDPAAFAEFLQDG